MIMAVFRRPVLWNMTIDIYRDKNKTDQAWKEIGEEFGLPAGADWPSGGSGEFPNGRTISGRAGRP